MGKMPISDWDRKWRLMMDRENDKRTQREEFREKLREKKELDDSIECTFHPKTMRKGRNNPEARSSKEELLKLLFPIITYEESILRELRNVEDEEESNRQELGEILCSAIAKFPDQPRSYFLDFYRDERLKDLWTSRSRKLEVVAKLQELERKFNVLCSAESVDPEELRSVGFEIDNCRKIRDEILAFTQNSYSLKNRSKVSSEFEEILRRATGSNHQSSATSTASTAISPQTTPTSPYTLNGLYSNGYNNGTNNHNYNSNNNNSSNYNTISNNNTHNNNSNNNNNNFNNINNNNSNKGYNALPLDYLHGHPKYPAQMWANQLNSSQSLVPRHFANPHLSPSNNPHFRNPVYLRHNY